MQIHHGIGDEGTQLCASHQVITIYLSVINPASPDRLQDAIVLANSGLELFRKKRRLHKVGNAQSGPCRFITVGGAYSALCGTDLRMALPQFPLFIKRAV